MKAPALPTALLCKLVRSHRAPCVSADVPYGFHHEDQGYNVDDPLLTPNQKRLLEFPPEFINTPEEQYDIFPEFQVHEEWGPRSNGTTGPERAADKAAVQRSGGARTFSTKAPPAQPKL